MKHEEFYDIVMDQMKHQFYDEREQIERAACSICSLSS